MTEVPDVPPGPRGRHPIGRVVHHNGGVAAHAEASHHAFELRRLREADDGPQPLVVRPVRCRDRRTARPGDGRRDTPRSPADQPNSIGRRSVPAGDHRRVRPPRTADIDEQIGSRRHRRHPLPNASSGTSCSAAVTDPWWPTSVPRAGDGVSRRRQCRRAPRPRRRRCARDSDRDRTEPARLDRLIAGTHDGSVTQAFAPPRDNVVERALAQIEVASSRFAAHQLHAVEQAGLRPRRRRDEPAERRPCRGRRSHTGDCRQVAGRRSAAPTDRPSCSCSRHASEPTPWPCPVQSRSDTYA